jgi:hypothetical protein
MEKFQLDPVKHYPTFKVLFTCLALGLQTRGWFRLTPLNKMGWVSDEDLNRLLRSNAELVIPSQSTVCNLRSMSCMICPARWDNQPHLRVIKPNAIVGQPVPRYSYQLET